MYTSLRATSKTVAESLKKRFKADPSLEPFYGESGTMVISLGTPDEMSETNTEGVSAWLYRVVRDEERLNRPRERVAPHLVRRPPLPLRLHYLITAVAKDLETRQALLGKVLQTFHDHPVLRGDDLQDNFRGTENELHVRLEPLSPEETARIWDVLDSPYQLSVSYEVSMVNIESMIEPEKVSPVLVALPEHGLIVSSSEE